MTQPQSRQPDEPIPYAELTDRHLSILNEQLSRLAPDADSEAYWGQMKPRFQREWLYLVDHTDDPAERWNGGGEFEDNVDPETEALLDRRLAARLTSPPPRTDAYTPEADDDLNWPFDPIDWTTQPDPADELVEGLIVSGRWTQFIALAKAGKSSLLEFIAIQLSLGVSPFDGTPRDPITVLWMDGEMGRNDLQELIEACGHDPAKLDRLVCVSETARLDSAIGAERLAATVALYRPQLVVFDGLNGFVDPSASDNSDDTWKPFFDRTIRPLKRANIAVVSGDNMGKDAAKGSRGSSVKNDKADAVIEVAKTENGVRLRATHSRAGAFLSELSLLGEGFDRSKPIRYWRSTLGSIPAGTHEAIKTLDAMKVPLSDGRDKVRKALKAKVEQAKATGIDPAPWQIQNAVLSAALRSRRAVVAWPEPVLDSKSDPVPADSSDAEQENPAVTSARTGQRTAADS